MRVTDIDFTHKMMYYTTHDDTAPPNRICVGECTYLLELTNAPSQSYTDIAFPYYHKLYAYHDRFDEHMPDSLRMALLQEIEDEYG